MNQKSLILRFNHSLTDMLTNAIYAICHILLTYAYFIVNSCKEFCVGEIYF